MNFAKPFSIEVVKTHQLILIWSSLQNAFDLPLQLQVWTLLWSCLLFWRQMDCWNKLSRVPILIFLSKAVCKSQPRQVLSCFTNIFYTQKVFCKKRHTSCCSTHEALVKLIYKLPPTAVSLPTWTLKSKKCLTWKMLR